RFRATGLAAGQYLLSVTPGVMFVVEDGRQIGTMTGGDSRSRVYYPSVSRSADAQPIALAAGQELAGITLTVGAPRGFSRFGTGDPSAPLADRATIATLRGRVTSTDGRPLAGASVSLIFGEPGNPILAAITDRSGAYEMKLPNVRSDATYRI